MTMPVNVFGRRGELGDLAYRLVGALDGSTVETAPGSARVRGRLPAAPDDEIIVEVTTEHLTGPQGDRQRAGMARWLDDPSLDGSGREAALALVGDLVVSVAFVIDDAAGQAVVDAVVDLAVRVASWADGFVVAMASGVVLGPDGALWLEPTTPGSPGASSADVPTADLGGIEPEAAADAGAIEDPFVREARRVLGADGAPEHGVVLDAELAEAVPPAEPPAIDRVARRLIVVAACAARSLAEADGDHLAEARGALLDWVEGTGAAVELEPWEATLLAAAPGGVDERDRIDGSWRTEGAAVLAWSLGLVDLPPPDQVSDPGVVFAAIGLAAVDATEDAIGRASARADAAIEVLRRQLLTVHWRLVEHRLRPGPIDLAAVATQHSWGPLTVEGLPLVDGDLAIGGRPVAEADPEDVGRATSIAMERHRAVNWLVEGGSFTDTDVAT